VYDLQLRTVEIGPRWGLSGNVNVVMESKSMAKRGPKPSTLEGISKYGTITYNNDRSIMVHKSYRVGSGKTIPAEELDALMGTRIPHAPATFYQPNSDEGALQHRAQLKGTFQDERLVAGSGREWRCR
jgi:hypothetical protein